MRVPVNTVQTPFQPQAPYPGSFPQPATPAQTGQVQPNIPNHQMAQGVNQVLVPQMPPPNIQRFTLVDLAGKEFPLQMGVNTVGREVGNAVCFPSNSTVSRSHAQIVVEASGATLTDNGSANGTSVNGVPIVGQVLLQDGDAIMFGAASLKFRVS